MRTYNGIERPDFTPGFITQLKADEVFVFGSNLAGMHSGGVVRENPALTITSFCMPDFGIDGIYTLLKND